VVEFPAAIEHVSKHAAKFCIAIAA
jgi:hypothetical protein